MATQRSLGLRDHLTHRANLRDTRYGWLRLTPAYSVHLVSDLLATSEQIFPKVLDPFCGTGTTALVCAERGILSDTTDINPFLVWLTETKTRNYQKTEVEAFNVASRLVANRIEERTNKSHWIPPLHQIEKWWEDSTLQPISRGMDAIKNISTESSNSVVDLLKVAFCRTVIDCANVSFGHQSMSFKKDFNSTLFPADEKDVAHSWRNACDDIAKAAHSPILTQPRAILCDARQLTHKLPNEHYSCVITSPPYPNRMSYIRELRPYMYWLGYLEDGRDAGELDWKAIGGTWGCATSNVGKWVPPANHKIPYSGFDVLLENIAQRSSVLSRYVHKYFYDMVEHVRELFGVVRPQGVINYIVGNSKFFDVLLPVEEIFAALFRAAGFDDVVIRPIRKRTSKKELYEYVVSARKP